MQVGLLGGSGRIAQAYRTLLEGHPWFSIGFVASRSEKGELGDLPDMPLLFSSLPSHLAKRWELFYVEKGYTVISSSSAFRMDPAIPLIIPELNFQIPKQPWKGCLIAKPNCSIQSFLLPLGILHPHFPIDRIQVTTMQAVSGAGKISEEFLENIIPYIQDEERKCEEEPRKILGAPVEISAQCNRVPVEHGHLASCSVAFKKRPSLDEMLQLWRAAKPLDLPSSPKELFSFVDIPQPRFHLKPMEIQIGRLRPCPLFDWRFVALSHNCIRGGAGGGLLIAEQLYKEGHFG